ncbi:MAG: hypothetical protein CL681_01685 [Blastopirellula sp.]|nr:hypothetical protein [Blastopirellula sp.]MAR08670.1 hypothetical protein [Blastopirellula sp.]|tara:strand:+ start:432 stop:632 length:201 start_codon:yes stop_codon:yes gene_type:complete
MHYSWEKHLELSRNVSMAADKDTGVALALMGIALTILANDLLLAELRYRPCDEYLSQELPSGKAHN